MLPPKDLETILISKKLLAEEEIKEAKRQAREEKLPLEEYLISVKGVKEADLYRAAAEHYGLPFEDLENRLIPGEILNIIPQNLAVKHQMVAFDRREGRIYLATALPPDLQAMEYIVRKEEAEVVPHFTTSKGIILIVGQYRKDIAAEIRKITVPEKEIDVVDLVSGIMENAIKERASDVHLEPQGPKSSVRYRLDGVLREVATIPAELHSGMVSRIKVLSNLKVDERRLPQDGRFKLTGPEYIVSVRVSIVPLTEGEKIVMRILRQEERFLTMAELGLSPGPMEIISEEIVKAQGMLLVVGPTGSGKTTTLYTLINLINKPGINISTIEDPVEYAIPGVNQSQVNPAISYTFAVGLRAFMRQDPNVIMVGEVRDQETAEIALHAALTGHLVLSTLHTNDAATTLPRLREMGIPAYLVASTVNSVLAQRLVRTVCDRCREEAPLQAADFKAMAEQVGAKPEVVLRVVGLERPPKKLFRGKGCKVCGMTGLRGRVGIYELLRITPDVRGAILRQVTAVELGEIARRGGMVTMAEDGLAKVLEGRTTFEEVLRVL